MENQSSLKEQLYLLEERLLQPGVRKSVKDLEILIADDFIEFGSSGRTYNKQQVIDGLPTEPIVQMALKDFQVKFFSARCSVNNLLCSQIQQTERRNKVFITQLYLEITGRQMANSLSSGNTISSALMVSKMIEM